MPSEATFPSPTETLESRLATLKEELLKFLGGGSNALGAGAVVRKDALLVRSQTATVLATELVDGTAAVGTKVLAITIPKGAILLPMKIVVNAGFAGDTSATIKVGDGSDADRYMTGTPDVFTTAADGVQAGLVSGALLLTSANTPTVTITSAADITAVITDGSGSVTLTFYYIETVSTSETVAAQQVV